MEITAQFGVHSAGDSPQGIGSSVYSLDKQPSNSIRGHSSPLESGRQALGISRVRKGDDQAVKVDGVASSSGRDVDTGNMLICFQMRQK